MNEDRLAMLKRYHEEDPSDPFNIYALAIEYKNIDKEESIRYFKILLSQHPEYLPTYYHAAELYAETGNKDLAEETYIKGIALAKVQSNLRTLREIQTSYNNFLFDNEG